MENFKIQPIDESHNPAMLAIQEAAPVKAGGLTVCFDKSPDMFFISRMKYTDSMHVGFFLNGELKGFASCGYSDVRLNRQTTTIFTLYNFYLLPEARGRRLPEKAVREFLSDARGKASCGMLVTMKGNRQAESFIGRRGYSWIPPSRIITDWEVKSILFSYPVRNNSKYMVRNAKTEDIPEIVHLLNTEHSHRDFGSVFREEDFIPSLDKRGLKIEDYYVAITTNGFVKGVCLAWDCTSFRRTKVMEFGRRFYPVLATYKMLEKIFRMAPFPRRGESFKELTITDYATTGRDTAIMHALLAEIYHRHLKKGYHFMNFASCSNDPFLGAARGFWHQNTVSSIVFTSADPNWFNIPVHLPYIDIAFL
jgi:GNAT superfamily N-acetyltransferase